MPLVKPPVFTMHLVCTLLSLVDTQCIRPFRPKESVGRKGQIHCVSTRPLVGRERLYQIHAQSLSTHRGKHTQVWGCPREWRVSPCLPKTLFVRPRVWEPAGAKKKKTINRKHISIFPTALVGQSSQGRIPTRPRDKRDKMAVLLWNSTEKGRFVPGTGPNLSQGGVPFVPGTVWP